jgi:hypothetical protein
MTEPSRQSRSEIIERRLQILEMEAAVQRTTLAATFAEWERRGTLSWVFGAAKLAGGILATPTVKWMATALLMRVIRRRFG